MCVVPQHPVAQFSKGVPRPCQLPGLRYFRVLNRFNPAGVALVSARPARWLRKYSRLSIAAEETALIAGGGLSGRGGPLLPRFGRAGRRGQAQQGGTAASV